MNSWVDLHALWRIVVIGLACGAGLPALFAVGLRVLTVGEGETTGTGANTSTAVAVRVGPARLIAAGLCFAAVLAAVGWGIYLIVSAT